MKAPSVILGIDPGTLVMGYGLIKVSKNTLSLLEMGVVQLAKKQDHGERLEAIYRKLDALIRLHQPDALAIEAPFFGKNVQSMLKLGRAQGVVIAAGMMNGLRAFEYAPRKVKQAVTGNGNASKEQVWKMLQHLLRFEEDPRFLDASDAVAVAICHHLELKNPIFQLSDKALPALGKKEKKANWADFLAQHPDKLKKGT